MATELDAGVGDNGDPAAIANALVAKFREIETALVPLIGVRGVAALYKRSLFLALPTHPWLAGAYEDVRHPMTLDALHAALRQQDHDAAIAGSQALLDLIEQLLVSLVGPALTERLLYAAPASDFRNSSRQDSP